MFDKSNSAQNNPPRVIAPAGEPTEFIYQGHHFHIHAITSRWSESGGWWNRISDGTFHPDDQARAVWKVEAAPIGTLQTFELERDDLTGVWIIKAI